MRVRINPRIVPVETGNQPYPLIFRMSRWHYVIAACTILMSLFFIGYGLYQAKTGALLLLVSLGTLFLLLSLAYIFQISNSFVELDNRTMRYREYRKIVTLDLDQIYVELLEGAFYVYSPQHPRIIIGSQYKDTTLLHSLLYKYSEENTSRADAAFIEDYNGYKSFSDKISGDNRRKQRRNDVLLVLLFIAANLFNYYSNPGRELIDYFLFFILTLVSSGVAIYTGRRRAARRNGQ